MNKLFSFPDPVNETSSRIVAAGVSLLAILAIITASPLVFVLIALGFLARVLTGPTLSPLGQIATRIISPLFPASYCPGPPKRFAQAIGLLISAAAAVLIITGNQSPAILLMIVLLIFALLESTIGFCMGCKVFSLLMKVGLIPEEICERCNNITTTAN